MRGLILLIRLLKILVIKVNDENKRNFVLALVILLMGSGLILIFGSVDCPYEYDYYYSDAGYVLKVNFTQRLITCNAEEKQIIEEINNIYLNYDTDHSLGYLKTDLSDLNFGGEIK